MTRSMALLAAFACTVVVWAGESHGAPAKKQAAKRVKKGEADRAKAGGKTEASIDPQAVNNPATRDVVGPDAEGAAVLRAQILLDRAHFSPGEIDGSYGDNLRLAIEGYQGARKIPVNGTVDAATWDALNSDSVPPLVEYIITQQDAAGPYEDIPQGMMEQAQLKALGYRSPAEAVGERFHVNPKTLEMLNPGKAFKTPGVVLLVPNVQRPYGVVMADRIAASKNRRSVQALAADGTILAQYPATMGSEHDPLPIGDWQVTVVQQYPVFHYNPDLFWNAPAKASKADIQPGPNNPVGVVWIGLSKEHYGIHGTPEPGAIGHAESHGCVRLTNWDAAELSLMVKPGTPVVFGE